MPGAPFLNLVLAFALVLMVGWLLIVGQAIILPIVLAIIAVYILTTAAEALGRVPVVRHLPSVVLHGLVLLLFTLAVVALALIVAVTMNDLVAAMPRYQQNLEGLAVKVAAMGGLENATWDDIVDVTVGKLNLQAIMLRVLGGVSSLGLTLFLVVVYSGFLIVERRRLPERLAVAFPQGDQAELTGKILRDVNSKIGDYLTIKTGINIILGALSFVILWGMGVDFALFWAVMIGLFNYIPYAGSILGVILPVTLSLAQFGSLGTTAVLGGLLIAAQAYVGNILEPRVIGRQLNLSPLVVLVSLSVWATIWGLPGALLAIPLTAMIAIICGAFAPTRFIAVLLANEAEGKH
ncbi:MAG: AI-2E family transporter [Rhodobacterales bacterium]|nr:AI-2E family transporter [Rhodobacterales bacterium]